MEDLLGEAAEHRDGVPRNTNVVDCALSLEVAQTRDGFEDFGGRDKFYVVEVDDIEVGCVQAGERARYGVSDPGGGVVEFGTADATAFCYEVVCGAGVVGEDLWLLEGAAWVWIRRWIQGDERVGDGEGEGGRGSLPRISSEGP